MRGETVDERDTTWETSDARYRLFVYSGADAAVRAIDIVDASLDDVMDSTRALAENDRNLWSLALVVDEAGPRGRGLVWLSGTDYHRAPASAFEWRRRAEMQNRYLSARSRRGEPVVLPNGLRVVRMFPEWGVRWPLWESFTDNYPMDAGDLGLSEPLVAELAAWNSRWQDRDLEDPLPAGWHEEGWALYRRLQAELDGVAEVRPDFDH
ncbi:hypothetical protein [Microbacterium sp. B35-04]|uniref:hypothetical protein n=1 Tax=Microbacterium sp. B35-04 TaxID=1961716 RepID=UPI0013D7E1FD|nr:hypothetical protein [Microbacterium sp. B35-04]